MSLADLCLGTLNRPQVRIVEGLLGGFFVDTIVCPERVIPAQFPHPAEARA